MLVLKLTEDMCMWNLHLCWVRRPCGDPSCEFEGLVGNCGWWWRQGTGMPQGVQKRQWGRIGAAVSQGSRVRTGGECVLWGAIWVLTGCSVVRGTEWAWVLPTGHWIFASLLMGNPMEVMLHEGYDTDLLV